MISNEISIRRPWGMIVSLLVVGVIFAIPTVWLTVTALTLKGEAYALIFVAIFTAVVSLMCLGYGFAGLRSKDPQQYIFMSSRPEPGAAARALRTIGRSVLWGLFAVGVVAFTSGLLLSQILPYNVAVVMFGGGAILWFVLAMIISG